MLKDDEHGGVRARGATTSTSAMLDLLTAQYGGKMGRTSQNDLKLIFERVRVILFFPFRIVSFLPCDHGLDFLYQPNYVRIQSIDQLWKE